MSAARLLLALRELARRTAEKGSQRILISGADPRRMVPLLDLPGPSKIRSELGLKVLVHTGLVSLN
jgi:uncharacterized radical SAM superfamily protein